MKTNMKCEKCGQPASVYYEENINGKTKQMHLCAACAKSVQSLSAFADTPFFADDFFGVMPFFQGFFPGAKKRLSSASVCPTCHHTLAQIQSESRFGCSDCYAFFADQIDLEPFMKGSYRGGRLFARKKAAKPEEADKKQETPADQLRHLKKELKEAVKAENYEEAARLRDRIRAMEG